MGPRLQKIAEIHCFACQTANGSFADPSGTQRKTASYPFGPTNGVGDEFFFNNLFPSAPVSEAAQAALDLVQHKEKPVLITDTAQAEQKFLAGGGNTPFALDR